MNQYLHYLHNKYLIAFIITAFLIFVEFDYYLNIEINMSIVAVAVVAGLISMVLMYQKTKGRLHFGVFMFLIGFTMLLVAGTPLVGGATFGGEGLCNGESCWTIPDDKHKTTLAIIAFIGLVLIVINFKAYMQNWIFARPMSLRKG